MRSISEWWRKKYAAKRYRDRTAAGSRMGGVMSDKIYDYDPAAALESEEAIAIFLADALEVGTQFPQPGRQPNQVCQSVPRADNATSPNQRSRRHRGRRPPPSPGCQPGVRIT